MTQPIGSGAPLLITETIEEPVPQIGEPLLAGQTPDFTADYIFCNNLVAANSISAPPSGVRAITTATTSGPTTTSGTFVDLPEMTITFTLTVITNVLVWFSGMFSHTTLGQQIAIGVVLDGGGAVLIAAINAKNPPNNGEMINGNYMFPNVGVGTHTIKIQWSTQAATASNVSTVRYMTIQA